MEHRHLDRVRGIFGRWINERDQSTVKSTLHATDDALERLLGERVDRQAVLLDRDGDRLVGTAAGAEVPKPLIGFLELGGLVEGPPEERAIGGDRRSRVLGVGVGVVGSRLAASDIMRARLKPPPRAASAGFGRSFGALRRAAAAIRQLD
jgi:hypothetical protein